MAAAESQRFSPSAASEQPEAVEYPKDCTLWIPTAMDGIVRFDAGIPVEQHSNVRWRRNIVLRPKYSQRSVQDRLRDARHDRIQMHLFSRDAIFRFSTERVNVAPRRRFHDHGPTAVLSLYTNDVVTMVTDNLLTRDIPHIEGTVIIVTWNRHCQTDRCRHIAIVPNLIIDWPARK